MTQLRDTEMYSPELTVSTLDPDDPRVELEPFLRIRLEGGCDLPGCYCSDQPFLSVSDGTTLFSIRLDKQTIGWLQRTGQVDSYPVVVDDWFRERYPIVVHDS